jgi:2-polyprenyl-3-methyl-5-hydroxy-6-metoxy-1,4-benzoquinol methylase
VPDQHHKKTSETWNKVASLYEARFMDLDLYNGTYDMFCEQLEKKNARILEIGCGPGNITRYILAKRPDFKIQGIDIAPNMIALAKKNNPLANFEVMDCRQISQLKTKFDGIICGFCLPYLSQQDSSQLIKDCASLLAPHGIFYLSFVEGDYENSGDQTGSSGDHIYFYYHSLYRLKKDLAENEFKVVHLTDIKYQKSDGAEEVHRIVIGENLK